LAARLAGMTSLSTGSTVTVGAVEDLVCVVPFLLGFHPSESLVVVAMRQPRDQLAFTLRVDLPPRRHERAAARMCAERMALAGADGVLAFVFTDLAGPAGELPRARLVESLQRLLDVPLLDALLVRGDRVWSYVCAEGACCPPEGRRVDPGSPAVTSLAAAGALAGRQVLAGRDALVREADGPTGGTERAMRQAVERSTLASAGARPALSAYDDALAAVLDRAGPDSPLAPSPEEAAVLGLGWHDPTVRDAMMMLVARDEERAADLVRAVAALMPPPYDAPAATLLAWVAYLDGCGVVAAAALDRALATEPGYSLARLLADALAGQVPPGELRRLWQEARMD
jgi:Domain of unknown function (DUF4192)